MKMFQPLLFSAAAAFVLVACTTSPKVAVNTAPAVVAPAPTVVMGATSGAFTAVDRDFALTAASANMLEIGASRMAPRRAGDADVLAYANTLNQHHTMAMNELAAIMSARGVAVPTQLPQGMQPIMNRLGTTTSGEFDRYFISDVGIDAHTAAINQFQQRMPALSDPDLKAWAAKTLPTLQQHLQMAQQIANRIG